MSNDVAMLLASDPTIWRTYAAVVEGEAGA